ncbi:hypothetical protein SAMN06265373_10280 [Shimia sagamensis]|uniref:Uncharacterized protein n=1 Tax=Shimia sagamensis TaxID=1566352 RepID=A0ABY1NHX8_9RHOB|nr:hypothetical protein SAMN06265373_10280 [Shimia sagamensis]
MSQSTKDLPRQPEKQSKPAPTNPPIFSDWAMI